MGKHSAPDFPPSPVESVAKPSQIRRPWRATARTVAAAAVALMPALPSIAEAAGIETVPFVASILTTTALITRILAIPEVDDWMDQYLPGLSADPTQHKGMTQHDGQ